MLPLLTKVRRVGKKSAEVIIFGSVKTIRNL